MMFVLDGFLILTGQLKIDEEIWYKTFEKDIGSISFFIDFDNNVSLLVKIIY